MECKPQEGETASRRAQRTSKEAPPRRNGGQSPVGPEQILEAVHKTVFHFFPELNQRLDRIHDPRDPEKTVYPLTFLFWEILVMFLFQLGARRRLRFELNSPCGLDNLNRVARTRVKSLPHPDTLIYPMKNKGISPEASHEIRLYMVRCLLRMRALEKFRLLKRFYLVAIDGTWTGTSTQRHCPRCLKTTHENGQTLYHHAVLEAKLVCSNGLVVSMGSEPIRNTDGQTKQDCETRAFYRLLPKLRKDFPYLDVCLLLDGLYLSQQVLGLCEKHRCSYIITFKEGSLPAAYRDYQDVHTLCPEQTLPVARGSIRQRYRWVNDLEHQGHRFNAFECVEAGLSKPKTFLWATNIEVFKDNVVTLAEEGGRQRWKIENEGFNSQKNGGFRLEHSYCKDWNTTQHFYILLQCAHLIWQLLCLGNLLPSPPPRLFGSLLAFASRLLDAWRFALLDPSRLRAIRAAPCQIRFRPNLALP